MAPTTQAADMAPDEPLMIQEQGSFAVGGRVITHPGTYDPFSGKPDGQTLHGDHAYVSYQVPVAARRHPIVFLHGNWQFAKTWETTPDGREGFNNLFLRRRWPVYLVDQPRRGRAGRSTLPMQMVPETIDQSSFNTFRVGIWPDYFPGVQFPRDAATLDQYLRQLTPNTGPWSLDLVSDAMAALFDKIGPSVLVTHSQGGGSGWRTAIKSDQVRAIVSWEPGSNYVFPKGEVPAPMPSSAGTLEALAVPLDDFLKLTRIPIAVIYGDFIPEEPVANPGQDAWRVRLAMARLWVDAINRHGGDATLMDLPRMGIHGNTHFPFSDLNNVQMAKLMAQFLASKGLD